jgi:hypothetical protein
MRGEEHRGGHVGFFFSLCSWVVVSAVYAETKSHGAGDVWRSLRASRRVDGRRPVILTMSDRFRGGLRGMEPVVELWFIHT